MAEHPATGQAAWTTARAALRAGRWATARAGFEALAEESGDPAAYEGLARAAWWLDDAEACLRGWEEAYRRHREAGDDRGAGRVATDLAWDCVVFGRGGAVARGWLGRARDLLTPVPECAEHGWLAIREAEHVLALGHDPAAALGSAEQARAIGDRLHVNDLAVTGLALSGLALVGGGQVPAGMSRLDTAVAAATGGDVTDLMWMGKVCCWLIAACHNTTDLTRAIEWCQQVQTLCVDRNLGPLLQVCRVQYASVQVAQGSWVEAEQELNAALAGLAGSRRASRLDAVLQLGELRRRQGRAAEADGLFAQAEFQPAARVGRALIRLERGDAPGAWTAISELLRSWPVADRVGRAAALLPAVTIACAAGSFEAATGLADELRSVADAAGTAALLAQAAAAAATLADADPAGGPSAPLWREAVRCSLQAGLCFDAADNRLHLAVALLDEGDRAGAREQVEAATSALRPLSAAGALARAERLALQTTGAAGPLTRREAEILRLVADGLSNQAVGNALVISGHTVHRHIANILRKLDQPSRTAAVAYALTHDLI